MALGKWLKHDHQVPTYSKIWSLSILKNAINQILNNRIKEKGGEHVKCFSIILISYTI